MITKQWLFAVYHLFTNNKSFPFFYSYVNNTEDIKHLTADGIELTNGKSLEAEIKFVLPDWQPHSFMKDLPIVDEEGFVITDLTMRNPDYPQIFAVGDAAALKVPKLGTLGDMQAKIVALHVAKDLGKVSAEKADEPFRPVVICMGDIGRDKAFYIHSDAPVVNSISPLPTGKTFDKLYKCHFGCKGGFRAWLMFVRYAPKE